MDVGFSISTERQSIFAIRADSHSTLQNSPHGEKSGSFAGPARIKYQLHPLDIASAHQSSS